MRISKITIAFCLSVSLTGCAVQKYHPASISAATSAASLQARTLEDIGLHAFLWNRLPAAIGEWPLKQWTLPELTLAAFYYNPALQIARDRLERAQAAIVTAGERPNPSIRGDLGGETSPESPWIAGAGFSLPIETAGKRSHRIVQAQKLADATQWDLASTGWSIRAQVRSALLEYLFADRGLQALEQEERLRAEQVQLFEQRLAAGMISRPEVDTARIRHTQILLGVAAANGRKEQAEARLATAIGVPAAALHGIKFSWPGYDQPPSIGSLTPDEIQQNAVLNRLDVRHALAEYSASEAGLQLEIAKQYPDFNLGPSYAFEEGQHLFSLAASLVLPVFNRNQGPIAEAAARRQQMAAQFLATQSAGIAASEQALAKYRAALDQLMKARQLTQQALGEQKAQQQLLAAGQSDRVALNGAQLQVAVTSIAELQAVDAAQQALGELEDAVQRPLLPGDIQPLSPKSPALNLVPGRPS